VSVQESSRQYRKSITLCTQAVDEVVHETISCDKIPVVTVLHCNIYLAFKILLKFCSLLSKASHQQKCTG